MIRLVVLCLLVFSSIQVMAPSMRLRGLRIDSSFFYNLHPKLSNAEIIEDVLRGAKAADVNTLFIYAYNSVYGAFYTTDYIYTSIEQGYGLHNIFKELTAAAKKNGLKVVAVVPINNFKIVWDEKPEWRAKTLSGEDYVPTPDSYLLSAWHPKFRVWLKNFYKDLITQNPDLDGVEAVEPFVDYNWDQKSDYNYMAKVIYKQRYPEGKFGDLDWLNFRAQGLTDLIGILNTVAHSFNKATFLVQTWPAQSDGQLFSSAQIKDNMGLDLDHILNLEGPEKLDFIIVELMWQQWAAEYGVQNFPVIWTRRAALDFIRFVNSRAEVLVHLEISGFEGAQKKITPTKSEFMQSLISIRDLNIGIEVYDYSQINKAQAWPELRHWY